MTVVYGFARSATPVYSGARPGGEGVMNQVRHPIRHLGFVEGAWMTRPMFGVLRNQNSSNFSYCVDYSKATGKNASKHGMGMFFCSRNINLTSPNLAVFQKQTGLRHLSL
jgi:hypothetical protein